MKDQWDYVLSALEELGVKEFLVLMGQNKMKSFLVASASLPLYSSTNVEIAQNGSEETPLTSRIQSLHLPLEVDHHEEEEYSVVLTLDNRWANNLVVQYRSKFFPQWMQFLWMNWQKYVFCGFVLAFDRLAKSKYIRFQLKIFDLHLSGFLLVVVFLLVVAQVRDQFFAMRNSDPRVRTVFVYRFNSCFHSIFTLWAAGCDFQHGPNFGVFFGSILLVVMIHLPLEECIHDRPLIL